MAVGRGFLDFDDLALVPVSGADLHGGLLLVTDVVPILLRRRSRYASSYTTIWIPLEQAKVSTSTASPTVWEALGRVSPVPAPRRRCRFWGLARIIVF